LAGTPRTAAVAARGNPTATRNGVAISHTKGPTGAASVTSQASLGQEKNMAKVMVELETADERRAFWREAQQRFETLHGKVWRLLSEQYFSK
jgi:hypothetical protein